MKVGQNDIAQSLLSGSTFFIFYTSLASLSGEPISAIWATIFGVIFVLGCFLAGLAHRSEDKPAFNVLVISAVSLFLISVSTLTGFITPLPYILIYLLFIVVGTATYVTLRR